MSNNIPRNFYDNMNDTKWDAFRDIIKQSFKNNFRQIALNKQYDEVALMNIKIDIKDNLIYIEATTPDLQINTSTMTRKQRVGLERKEKIQAHISIYITPVPNGSYGPIHFKFGTKETIKRCIVIKTKRNTRRKLKYTRKRNVQLQKAAPEICKQYDKVDEVLKEAINRCMDEFQEHYIMNNIQINENLNQ